MNNRLHSRWLSTALLTSFITFATTLAHAEKLTLERIFAAPDLSGASLRAPQISPDGRLVAYLRGSERNKDRLDLWAYDLGKHQHRMLVDSARLAPEERALSAEEEQRRERQRTSSLSGILEYQFSPDSRYLLVPLGGDLYVYDLRAKTDKAVHRITHTPAFETDAEFSPLALCQLHPRSEPRRLRAREREGAGDYPRRRRSLSALAWRNS